MKPRGLIGEISDLLGNTVKSRRSRRNIMFVICLGAMALVAAGFFPMRAWLEERPLFFLGYWGFTFLVVVLLMMLALYDILRILSRR